MAHANEVEEVSHEENSFSIDELELTYSHLLEKYSKLKHDNKDLKKKIKTYVHDSTPCSKCSLLERETEGSSPTCKRKMEEWCLLEAKIKVKSLKLARYVI